MRRDGLTEENRNIRTELRRWMNQHQWDISATLTFADPYSERQAKTAAVKFWREVDYYLYGNAARRRNMRCERVMFLEGDGEIVHHHYHAAIKFPKCQLGDVNTFCSFLRKRWQKMHPRCERIEFKPVHDSRGWVSYSTKEIGRSDCDRMDVDSSHIAAAQPENVRRFSTEIAA